MKGPSEGRFRELLSDVDLPGLIIYKPPDDARNWKPCDFMLWWPGTNDMGVPGFRPTPASAWVEVKDVNVVNIFPLDELRPSQRAGIRQADEIGLPYVLAIWWRRRNGWTFSNAAAVLGTGARTVAYTDLVSTYGIDAPAAKASSILRSVLEGEVW